MIRIARCSDETTAYRLNRSKALLESETGFDRVKRMYSLNEYGVMSPELQHIVSNCTVTSVLVGIAGAIVHMARTRADYMRKNVASTYESQHLARRHLQDTITLSGFKGALKFMLRYGIFSSAYLLSTMTAANYFNKVTVWEHAASGAVLGGLFRFRFGPKGVAAGGIVGAFLGGIAGGVIALSMRLSGTTVRDLRLWQHEQYYAHQEKVTKKAQT